MSACQSSSVSAANRPGRAGVVDQDVQPAKSGRGGSDEGPDLICVGHVTRHRQHRYGPGSGGARLPGQLRGRRLELVGVPGADSDNRALGDQLRGDRLAKALGSARDDRPAAGQPELHLGPYAPLAGSPGAGSPGAGPPGTSSPGTGSPGIGSPGAGPPGTGPPGTGPPAPSAPAA